VVDGTYSDHTLPEQQEEYDKIIEKAFTKLSEDFIIPSNYSNGSKPSSFDASSLLNKDVIYQDTSLNY
jgi:uncharacterized protein YozE (UPF0346 family)